MIDPKTGLIPFTDGEIAMWKQAFPNIEPPEPTRAEVKAELEAFFVERLSPLIGSSQWGPVNAPIIVGWNEKIKTLAKRLKDRKRGRGRVVKQYRRMILADAIAKMGKPLALELYPATVVKVGE